MKPLNFIKLNIGFIIIFVICAFYIFQFRYNLDKDQIFVSSDGQIKFYQAVSIIKTNFLNINCYYPNKEFDPSYKFYPIRYPWTIINNEKKNCVFEYPPFFPAIASLISFQSKNYRLLMYIPLIFYLGAFFILYLCLIKQSNQKTISILLALLFIYSFPLLTSMDFSESPLYLFSIMIAILFLIYYKGHVLVRNLFFGILLGIAIFFRMEILIPAFLFALAIFLFYGNWKDRFKRSISFGLGFLFPICIFFLYNYRISNHILGFRYISSLLENRVVSPTVSFKLQLLLSYLWGDNVMVGILKFYPILILIFLLSVFLIFRKKFLEIEFLFILSGFLSLFLIPLSVNFYGGVGYFGLRYLETPFLFILIGFGIYLNRKAIEVTKLQLYSVYLILLISLYWNHLSTKEGLKVLRNSSKDFSLLQNLIIEKNSIIIHTSLYTSIYLGTSFLETAHFHIPTEFEIQNFLNHLPKDIKNLIFLLPPKNMYISSDIPEILIKNYKTNIDLKNLNITIYKSDNLNGISIVKAIRIQ